MFTRVELTVEDRGDSEDHYDLCALRFDYYFAVDKPRAIETAAAMLAYDVSNPQISYAVAERLFTMLDNPVLAAAHVRRGLAALERVPADVRRMDELPLVSLELAIEASRDPHGERVRHLQASLMVLTSSWTLPYGLLLDAFRRLSEAGTLTWMSGGTINALLGYLSMRARGGDDVSEAVSAAEEILSRVPRLDLAG